MKQILSVDNSYSELSGFPAEVMSAIDQILTTHNDIEHEKAYLIKQIQYFAAIKDKSPKFKKAWGFNKKKLKDLLETEHVHHLVDNRFPTGLLNIVKDVLEALNPQYDFVDVRKKPEKQHDFLLCKDFNEARYYQEEVHTVAISEGRGVIEACVGSGKTLMAMRIIKELGVNTLIVVPSKALLEQWQPILEEHFGTRQVIRLDSVELSSTALRKVKKRPVRLVNIQALAALRKKGILKEVINDIDCVVFDEFHHAGSKSFTDLLAEMGHIYHRFGFTGTFLRNDAKILELWGVLSTVLYQYPAHKAIAEGFLTPIEVRVHRLPGEARRSYQSEYSANYCGVKKRRPEALLKRILEIITKQVGPAEPVLILVNRKDQCGAVISRYLEDRGIGNIYISGDSEPEEIVKALADFNAGKIRILIGSQIIGEGIDVRAAAHLILANGGKSEIAIVQATGRLVRLNQGKTLGILHDFEFRDTKYLEKHAKTRAGILKRNFAPRFKTVD
jgi:superfamily II DNA or RNA helicase